MTDRSLDEPQADVVEQDQPAVPEADDPDESADSPLRDGVPLEVNEADAAEQARDVGLGEEDYR